MRPDLISTRQSLLSQQSHPATEIDHCIAVAQSDACRAAFVQPTFDLARAAAAQPGVLDTPLAGLSVSVKDLFDVEGQVSKAGSTLLADHAPARADCPAVSRLRAAGGALIGRTHMVEFAFSGVGVNPHFGTPAAWDGRYDQVAGARIYGPVPRVPGGSSSGAAVSVATGAAFIGLGSDTGGSIRIPAALNGIVGFKSTARLVPTVGAIPLSSTLDTVCAMTRSVRDAVLAHEILAQRSVLRNDAPLSAYRIAVAQSGFLDNLDSTVAKAFERALQRLRDAGATLVNLPLAEVRELTTIQATGGFSAVEAYAWHRPMLARGPSIRSTYDPRVLARIERGAQMRAFEYMELVEARRAWITKMELALQGFDAVVSPTVPIVAPPIANVAPGVARDDAFFHANGLLLRNPSVVNMLDGCAISLPCHTADELPVGLMLWHAGLHDDSLLNIALQAEKALQF
ncbi:amidase/aspartyl-tRNA(Asn)/glutamyl-tRNA(Gln) amidotransferase subunit A [Rhodoferax ferrireducens]|uniref:Amidase/aspartyl-tRNA(Asn)/glutamyl-tRNA(Gln) amidotransferase subunit A n=1 Tax=Rhodoferax ferrireducens TaxID=192843 RepID=A0ABU2C388_9BURK|nr:amidase [Rhodoferax ferrireducens]MDR7375798.1 amidase/aspartyl-tRNA(Asn)/glutamyl-tRNA(Gln) amidotransferase subunit A [Rhodoferax ferrireducens]